MGSPTLRSNKLRSKLASNIKALLEEREWSENELARQSGVSQKQVNNICAARTGCGIDALDAIAHALQCEPWQLLTVTLPKIVANTSRPARVLQAYISMPRAEQEIAERLILGATSDRGK